MGKKQPLGAAKQRPGTDITRFLERKVPNKDTEAAINGRYVAGVRPPGGRLSTPGKHLLDNVLLSQDADDDGGMQVVWASSPTAAFSPQKGGGGSQEAASASQQQAENSQASKDGFRRTLIEAVQRAASDAELQGAALPPQQPTDDLLEQLLARQSSHRAASTSAPVAQPLACREQRRPPEEPAIAVRTRPGLHGFFSRGDHSEASLQSTDDQVMQEVLAGTDTYRTPGAARRPRSMGAAQSADYARQAMCTPSVLTLGGKRTLGASGMKPASGANKRRALLDLLEQVELMVKHKGAGAPEPPPQPPAPPNPEPEPGSCTAQQVAQAHTPSTEPGKESHAGPRGTAAASAAAPGGSGVLDTSSAAGGPSRAGPQADQPHGTRLQLAALHSDPRGCAASDGSSLPPAQVLPARELCGPAGSDGTIAPTQPILSSVRDLAGFAAGAGAATGSLAAVAVCGSHAPGSAVPRTALCGSAAAATQPCGAARTAAMPCPVTALGARARPTCPGGPGVAPHMTPAGPCRPVSPPGCAGPFAADANVVACRNAVGNAGAPQPRVVSPGLPADDDDDDDLWGDVDIDALVANATGKQPRPAGTSATPHVAAGSIAAGPTAHMHNAASAASVSQPPHPVPHTRPDAHNPSVPPRGGHPAAARMAVGLRPLAVPSDQSDYRPPDVRSTQQPPAAAAAAIPLLGDREEIHFVVLEVESSHHGHEKVLHCFNEYKGTQVRVCLRDMWADQEVAPGDTVNVVGGRSLASPTCTTLEVSAAEGLLVLHPDVLLSGTTVCTAIRCARQAWLQERVAQGSDGGEAALIGSMLHELLQRSLRAAISGKLDKGALMEEARSILSANTAKLLESQQDEAAVLAFIGKQVDSIIAWCNSYVTPNAGAPQGGRIEAASGDGPTFCRVTEVLDIEESIWAPKYGLKGQLDASLRVTLSSAEPFRPAAGQQQQHQQQQRWASQQEPARFHGMQHTNRRASAGPFQAVGLGPGHPQGVTGVISAAQPQQGHGSASKAGGGGMPPPLGPQAQVRQGGLGGQPDPSSAGIVVPFEFKTGKEWHDHRAQVLMYLLLMEDRYRTAVRTGLLWYSTKPTMSAVRYAHHELCALIMHRNRLAAYLVGAARQPPPPLQGSESDRKCDYCSVSATCALYLASAASEDGTGRDPAGLKAAAQQLAEMDLHAALRDRLATISPSCAAFFAQWVRLVDLEEQAVRSNRAEMWALTGPQREQSGGCVALLVLDRELPPRADTEDQRFAYVFRRKPQSDASQSGPFGSGAGAAVSEDEDGGAGGFLGSGFSPGDCALLGVEGRHAAAARVTVVDVTRDTLTLACKKELKYVKLEDTAQPRVPCSEAAAGRCGGGTCPCGSMRVTWRLDRDEAASMFAQLRLNLSLLGVPGAGAGWSSGGKGPGGRKGQGGTYDGAQARREGHLMQLRKLVIDLEPPQQGLGQSGAGSQLSASLASSQLQSNAYLREHAHKMNGEQLEAVQRVLAMQDYAILLGMPGTGKTTTIVHIIRALVETRASILIASYTNSAVDNILLKLVGSGVPFVRLGSAAAVHPAIRPYMPGGEHHPNTTVAGLQDIMARVNVVGCTCLSVHNPLLAGRTFGVCILDEASQVTLPASIGALALARSFLLVGDHYQLSPLVVSREAAQGGLGVSLFRRLSEAHPQAVVTLRSQYRMAADIMALSNALVYNGRMLCGNDAVANAKLHLPALALSGSARAPASPAAPWPRDRPLPDWLLALLQPECRVVFLDTDCVAGCRQVAQQDGVANRGEVHLVVSVVSALVAAGLPPGEIGVASPYKAQVALLQQTLSRLGCSSAPSSSSSAAGDVAGASGVAGAQAGAVEVLTVDKYQGRDKAAVLLSLVRCNASRTAGRLLADWQRLNVAITRARTKLVLVGSAATLASIPLLEDLLRLLRRNNWVTRLPVDCLAQLPEIPAVVSAAAVGAGPVVSSPASGWQNACAPASRAGVS